MVQKHDARRVHFDVRLEIGDTMMSWAVPKGPSYDPDVKRLAVETEDHPLEYASFEGRIPDGHYGAGDVLVWDRGTYETDPPGVERAMRAKGHFKVVFSGEKLRGAWHLVRSGRDEKQWLLFKAKDGTANAALDVVRDRPESIVSGRSATRGPVRVAASTTGRSARELLLAMGEVAHATSGPLVGDGSLYRFEIKFDGYRLLVGKAGSDVRIFTRKQNDWTERFAPIAAAVGHLAAREVVLDGEACVVDAEGRPSFGALQEWLAGDTTSGPPLPRGRKARWPVTARTRASGRAPPHRRETRGRLAFAAFDLLWLDGRDLRSRPLEERRELLAALLRGAEAPLSFSTAIEGESLRDLLAAARRAGLEGLVAKRRGSPYVSGPSTHWVKLKFERRQECVVCGYLPLSGSSAMGALLLGVRERPRGALVYAGRVGTGFDDRLRRDFARRLDAARRDDPPCERTPRLPEARWTEPRIVVEIGLTEWTRDGSARHPRYLGLREDKAPEDCVRESERPVVTVKLANPDKVLYPRDGVTKQRIFDYYTHVAPAMLPHLRGRPINMQRWPDGIDAAEWYQHQSPPKTPDWVRRLPFADVNERVVGVQVRTPTLPAYERVVGVQVRTPTLPAYERVVVENVETLQWLANLAALTMHAWSSHVPPSAVTPDDVARALGQPDWVCLDLDPGTKTRWTDVIRIAHAVRTLLDALGLESVPKTSGKRGLHVIVPLARGASHDAACAFAEDVARAVAKVLPEIATIERMKNRRGGRCYVDFGQNGAGRTLVAPYSLRAVDGAPVSTPLAWSEVTDKLDPKTLGMDAVLRRLDKHGDLFSACLTSTQTLPAVNRS